MTVYIIFDALKAGEIDLDHTCIGSVKANEVEGSRLWVGPGDFVSLEQIIKGILVASGNDAAIVAAETIAGTEEAFVERMNAKAQALGLTQTQYKNSHGLDEEGHYTTARDTAVLGYSIIRDHPQVLQYTSLTEIYHVGVSYPLVSQNPLLGNYPGADGLKTGNTDDAGLCLLGTAQQDGIRLISVIMGIPQARPELRYNESCLLLNYGFGSDFIRTTVLHEGELIPSQVEVRRANLDSIAVAIANDVQVVLRSGQEELLQQVAHLPDKLDAPVYQGDHIGSLDLFYDNELIATVPLLAGEDSGEASFFKALWQDIQEFFLGLFRVVDKPNNP